MKVQVQLNQISPVLRRVIAISVIACFVCSTAFAADNNSSASAASISNKVDDQTLEHKVNQVLSAQLPEGNFTVASYKNKVLLTGQVANAADKAKAETAVSGTAGVTKVWNYLSIGPNEDSTAIAKDAYLTSAAKARLIAQKNVNTNNIKVVTCNKVVYLLGQNAGKRLEIHAAVAGIQGINGVQHVVNLIGQ